MSTQKLAHHGITALRAILLIVGIILLLIFVPKSASGADDIEAVGGHPSRSLFQIRGFDDIRTIVMGTMTTRSHAEISTPHTHTRPSSTSTAAATQPKTDAGPSDPIPTTGAPDNDHQVPPRRPDRTLKAPVEKVQKAADTVITKTSQTPAADTTRSTMDKLLSIPQMMF